MNKHKRNRVLLAACLLLLMGLGGCRAKPSAPTDSKAKWTLLFYWDADNDLEEPAMNDLRQLLQVGSSSDVQMVMLCDRSELDSLTEGYSNERILNIDDWSSAYFLHLSKENAELLGDWGEVNMADPKTLKRFVQESKARYPADKYALFIGNHGLGWEGVCTDDSADEEDLLTLTDLAEALDGQPPLDFIGFDACSMATVETALTLAPFAKTMVASEELEPLLGWDYGNITGLLKERPDLDGVGLSKLILTSYRRSFDRADHPDVKAEGLGITLSAIDLTKMTSVDSALSVLSQQTQESLKKGERSFWLSLASARSKSEEYGEGESASYDLIGFAHELAAQTSDPITKKAASDLETATRSAVIETVRGAARPGSNGLSIYFPADGELLTYYASLAHWQSGGWPASLQLFHSQSRDPSDTLLTVPTLSQTTVLPQQPTTVKAKLRHPEEIAQLYLVLTVREANKLRVLGRKQIPIKAALSQEWDGTWLVSPTGSIFPEWSEDLARVPARLNGEDITLQMHGTKLVMATREGTSGVRQIHLERESSLEFLYPTIDSLGQRTLEPWDESAMDIETKDQLDLEIESLGTGEYEIGYLAVDFAGHWDLKVLPLRYGLAEWHLKARQVGL